MTLGALHRVFGPLRLLAGLAFIVAFLVTAHPTRLSIAAALPPLLAGLALRAWAAGHLIKRKTLTTSGPYAHTQNPLYLGSLLIFVGACTAARSMILWLAFVPLFALLHALVVQSERELSRRNFGVEFERYGATVPLFVPTVRPAIPSDNSWSSAQYLKNGEYNAAIGVVCALAFLIARL